MMQPEVLVETPQHGLQVTLLIAPFPVHVPNQPLVDVSAELPTTLDAGESNHGKSCATIFPADMFEAQASDHASRESAKEQQPSFLLGQFQIVRGAPVAVSERTRRH